MPLNALIPDRCISQRHLSAPLPPIGNGITSFVALASVPEQTTTVSPFIVRTIVVESLTRSGLTTIDGVALQAGDIVLYNTTEETDNGLYVVHTEDWVRTDDQLHPGQMVLVVDGNDHRTSLWVQERIFATYYPDETETHWVLVNEQYMPDELEVEQSTTVELTLESSLLRADVVHTNSDTVELSTTIDGLQATVREASLTEEYFADEILSQHEHPYYQLTLTGSGFSGSSYSWVVPQQVIGVRRAFPIGVYLVSVWVEISQVDGSNIAVNNDSPATLSVNSTTIDIGNSFDPNGIGSPKLIVNAMQGTCIVPLLSTTPANRTITITVQLPNGVSKFASGTIHLVRCNSQSATGTIETHPL
jgi:hypothetical protein